MPGGPRPKGHPSSSHSRNSEPRSYDQSSCGFSEPTVRRSDVAGVVTMINTRRLRTRRRSSDPHPADNDKGYTDCGEGSMPRGADSDQGHAQYQKCSAEIPVNWLVAHL